MAILSIQSDVVSGHVGNAAAVPVLQALGFDVWAIDTVCFSNHPGHGGFTGSVREAAEVAALVRGLEARALLGGCRAVLSGYLGQAQTGPIVMDALAQVRRAQARSAPSGALYCCDPVMGDADRFYVAADICEFFRDAAVPAADIVTPNAFEAAYLTGSVVGGLADARAAGEALLARGPSVALVTGVAAGSDLVTVAVDATGAWAVSTKRLAVAHHGAGDCLSALFLAQYLTTGCTAEALTLAASALAFVLRRTAAEGAQDLRLVPCLPHLRAPQPLCRAEAL